MASICRDIVGTTLRISSGANIDGTMTTNDLVINGQVYSNGVSATIIDSTTEMHNGLSTKYDQLLNTNNVVLLNNSHFANGTYIAQTPNVTLRLTENIVFNPNNLAYMQGLDGANTSYESGDVLPAQYATYDPAAYGIGFFAAIAVSTYNVIIDLNGFSLSQSAEHALQQRFYANIELADQPFVPNQGPSNFGNQIDSAQYCFIVNGTLGRSSHHGIHGNNNKNIMIRNVTFTDFEVAAVALNKAENISITDSSIARNRKDVPVLGIWSAGRFIRPYINWMVSHSHNVTLTVDGNVKTASDIKSDLRNAMNNVFDDLITNNLDSINSVAHNDEWRLFHNDKKVIEGNCYGLLTNSFGAAVVGFPDSRSTVSRNVYIKNFTINELKNNVIEIPALRSPSNNSAQIDQVGSVFQIENKDNNGVRITQNGSNQYIGNVVANAQAIVTKSILASNSFGPLSISRNNISASTLQWIEGVTNYDTMITAVGGYLCNGDSMFHVNKGLVGYKLDATENIYADNCKLYGAQNYGALGSTLCNETNPNYKNRIGKSHSQATYNGYNGSFARGWSLSSSAFVVINNATVSGLVASYGPSYGIDIHRQSTDVTISGATISGVSAGSEGDIDDWNNNPTVLPKSVGIHVEKNARKVTLSDISVSGSASILDSFDTIVESNKSLGA